MSGTEVLVEAENSATNGETVANVRGKIAGGNRGNKKKAGAITAGGFLTAMILMFMLIFAGGNYAIAAFNDRVLEETDMQCADGTENKFLILQQALAEGDLPSNTVARLRDQDVLVGYASEGGFREAADGNTLLVDASKSTATLVSAAQFINAVHSNITLYNAVDEATYSCAAYYYDNAAETVFKEIGTTRNNFTTDADFETVVSEIMGEGSDISVNGVVLVEKQDEDGNVYYEYETNGAAADSSAGAAFVSAVRKKSLAADEKEAAMNTAATVNVADTMSREQRSALYYALLMENFSKVKYGDGDEKINEEMNYLYKETESTVVDVNTGELTTVKGAVVNAPSLYSILTGEPLNTKSVENFANDRVLKTVQNVVGTTASSETMDGTVTSASTKTRGAIGRFLNKGSTEASTAIDSAMAPTAEASLKDNGFSTISGIAGGEFLVEGAVNVGKMLAKQSGGTVGDAAAVKSYSRLNSEIVALNAAADRLKRSPFDITSKNTFLGSIMYKFATFASTNGSFLRQIGTFSRTLASAVSDLMPATLADDETNAYLTNFGECPTIERIGGVGSASCTAIVVFDTSTLDDPFNNAEFIKFVEENTVLENGVRKIKPGSDLANFITYQVERMVTEGVTDGGALMSWLTGSDKVTLTTDIVAMVKAWLGADTEAKLVASGAAFVNSESNSEWEGKYALAQRYVGLARGSDALRQFDGDATAYTNLKYFEGTENPVVAFLAEYYAMK